LNYNSKHAMPIGKTYIISASGTGKCALMNDERDRENVKTINSLNKIAYTNEEHAYDAHLSD
jgi:hypothetical protein